MEKEEELHWRPVQRDPAKLQRLVVFSEGESKLIRSKRRKILFNGEDEAAGLPLHEKLLMRDWRGTTGRVEKMAVQRPYAIPSVFIH